MLTMKKILTLLHLCYWTLATAQDFRCSVYNNCECNHDAAHFILRCPKHDPAIFVSAVMNKSINIEIRCLSNKVDLNNFSAFNFSADTITLTGCAEMPYITELARVLPTQLAENVIFKGIAARDLHRIGEVDGNFVKKTMEISFYKIDERLLANGGKLQAVVVRSSDLRLTSDFFNRSSSLKKIDLSNNSLDYVPSTVFRAVKEVEDIDLSRNNLITLTGQPFRSLRFLKILNLERNKLRFLSDRMLQNLVSLEKLNLRRNMIYLINGDAFEIDRHYGKLRIVDLSYNNLTLVESTLDSLFSSIYRPPHHLELLDLSHNSITHFLSEWMDHKCADVIDVRYNAISTIDLKRLQNFYSFGKILNVHEDVDLYGEDEALTAHNSTIFLKGNPVAANEELQHLTQYYNFIANNDTLARLLDLNHLNCSSGIPYTCPLYEIRGGEKISLVDFCPAHCLCSVRPWEFVFVVDCASRGKKTIPNLNVTGNFAIEMHLENNSLVSGPLRTDGYDNVHKLFLSYNAISDIKWIPQSIEVLEIDNNNISVLSDATITSLKNADDLKYVALHNNPWICDCQAFKLIELLKVWHPYKKVHAERILCKNSQIKMLDLSYSDLCKTYKILALVLITSCIVVAGTLGITASLYYKYTEEIKIWLLASHAFARFIVPREATGRKINDAFICYTYQDEQYLVAELLPILEGGLVPYKIGIHIRDWLVGEFITTQMVKSIDEARTTIVILSPRFLTSRWGIAEFRIAHEKAMDDRSCKVIVILYEDVDVEEIPDESLKKYITTKSYITWKDKKFWTKLKRALPSTSSRQTTSYINLLQKEDQESWSDIH